MRWEVPETAQKTNGFPIFSNFFSCSWPFALAPIPRPYDHEQQLGTLNWFQKSIFITCTGALATEPDSPRDALSSYSRMLLTLSTFCLRNLVHGTATTTNDLSVSDVSGWFGATWTMLPKCKAWTASQKKRQFSDAKRAVALFLTALGHPSPRESSTARPALVARLSSDFKLRHFFINV